MSKGADKLGVDAHTHGNTHGQTDDGNDNTRKPKLASRVKTAMFYVMIGIEFSSIFDEIITLIFVG